MIIDNYIRLWKSDIRKLKPEDRADWWKAKKIEIAEVRGDNFYKLVKDRWNDVK